LKADIARPGEIRSMNWKFWSRRRRNDESTRAIDISGDDKALEALHVTMLKETKLSIHTILEIENTLFGRDMRQLLLGGYKPSLAIGEGDDRWTVYGRHVE
jgi:hypothetical protein